MPFLNLLQHLLAFGNSAILQIITIVVLAFTFFAVREQAKAADKLTRATERQIQTSTEQSIAAKQQVEVARRQVTESLRPILMLRNSPALGMVRAGGLEFVLINEGSGVALNVWWQYGEANLQPHERHYVQNGIIAPKSERSFRAEDAQVAQEGLSVVYESLAGVVSGTRITWTGNEYHTDYHPDITEWSRNLLGKPLRPTN